MADQSSAPRERLDFHRMWIAIEVPDASDDFRILWATARKVSGKAINDAWNHPLTKSPGEMNTGELIDETELEEKAGRFGKSLSKQLT